MSRTSLRAMLSTAAVALAASGCSADGDGAPARRETAARGPTVSAAAEARVQELRKRFELRLSPSALHSEQGEPHPVIARGVGARFEALGDGAHLRAMIPPEAKRGVRRTANVGLPLSASGEVQLVDDVSGVRIAFALRGAKSATVATTSDGVAVYEKALGESDVVHRVTAEGTEDFAVFETRPEREEITYDVDVSRVAGLRLVSNTLEFLDEDGTPALRVAPPRVVEASGGVRDARLAVDGCRYDTDPRGPWGRAVVRPGAGSCAVRVEWSGVTSATAAELARSGRRGRCAASPGSVRERFSVVATSATGWESANRTQTVSNVHPTPASTARGASPRVRRAPTARRVRGAAGESASRGPLEALHARAPRSARHRIAPTAFAATSPAPGNAKHAT